jgi:hypothetical protein
MAGIPSSLRAAIGPAGTRSMHSTRGPTHHQHLSPLMQYHFQFSELFNSPLWKIHISSIRPPISLFLLPKFI